MSQGPPPPPVAAVRPHAVRSPHGVRVDDYYWLRDDDAHSGRRARVPARRGRLSRGDDGGLAAARGRSCTGRSSGASGRTMRACRTATTATGTCTATTPATNTPSTLRRAGSADGPEQVLLDVRENARGLDYYDVGSIEVSHDNRLLAFTEDTVGPPPVHAALQVAGDGRAAARCGAERRGGRRLGGRQPARAVRRKGPGHAAGIARARARARHRSRARPGRARGGRRGVLHVRRPDQGPALPADRVEQHRHDGSPLRAHRRSRAGLQRVPAAQPRARVFGGPRRRTLGDPQQLAGREFPPARGLGGGRRDDANAGANSWRTGTTCWWRGSTCSTTFSRSRSESRACARSASGRGPARANSTSTRTSPRTAWRSTRTRRWTATSCATPTRRSRRRAPPTTTTCAPASGCC